MAVEAGGTSAPDNFVGIICGIDLGDVTGGVEFIRCASVEIWACSSERLGAIDAESGSVDGSTAGGSAG